jgi:hypothetical protein
LLRNRGESYHCKSILDPAFTSNDIIVADTLDAQALASPQGPLRIIPPRDSGPTRWIRMLDRLAVVGVRK